MMAASVRRGGGRQQKVCRAKNDEKAAVPWLCSCPSQCSSCICTGGHDFAVTIMFKVSFRGIQVLLSETAALSGQSTPPFKHGFRAEYAGKVPDNPRELWGLVMFDDSDEVKFQIKVSRADFKADAGLVNALLI